MNKPCLYLYICLLSFMTSCDGQTPKNIETKNTNKQEIRSYGNMTSSLVDKVGNLWIGTENEGVYKYDGQTFTNYSEKEGFCNNQIWTIIEDNQDNLWFGTANGLCKYDGTTFKNIPIPFSDTTGVFFDEVYPVVNPNQVCSMIQDKNGVFWLGTSGGGAYEYNGQTFTSILSNEGMKYGAEHHNVISSIIEDTKGNIWFTSWSHGGISRYDGKTFTHFNKENGLPDDMVFSSFEDINGKLWFGILNEGLFVYNNGSFDFFNGDNGMNNHLASCYHQDKTGKIWIGTFTGSTVYWYDEKKITPVPFDKDQKLAELNFMIEDKEGNIWFGGRHGILYRYDGQELKDFTQLIRS